MKKSTFAALLLGIVGGLLFSIGMCMTLIPEWNMFKPGVIMGGAGLLVLLVMILVWRKMENKAPIRPSKKTVGGILVGLLGTVLLGVGMCFVLVWEQMLTGIVIGILGIVVLLCLIPLTIGLK